ncbi:hypothetical protein Ct61P_13685 [Colletotrichum tofieldiae]|nr:hypothetical protein Ct61P_13685 [Colletotrichum tofieldiae]
MEDLIEEESEISSLNNYSVRQDINAVKQQINQKIDFMTEAQQLNTKMDWMLQLLTRLKIDPLDGFDEHVETMVSSFREEVDNTEKRYNYNKRRRLN